MISVKENAAIAKSNIEKHIAAHDDKEDTNRAEKFC
jgi:hypothetical protein